MLCLWGYIVIAKFSFFLQQSLLMYFFRSRKWICACACFTRRGQPVLVRGLVVIQRLHHHVYGEYEEPRQEDVETQVEENNETWRGGDAQSITTQ